METMVKTKWAVDVAHTEVHFKVKHLVISTVTGSFNKFEGTVYTSKDDFSDAQVEFIIDANSVHTNHPDRDTHLRSADFFNVAKYPSITFKSKSVRKKGESDYILQGDLTMNGITKEIELNVEHGGTTKDPWGNTKAGFEVTGKLSRKDYGLVWSAVTETGGMVVGDEVKIQINIELIRQNE
jgi:polyisoprenoid-binding protein YceI